MDNNSIIELGARLPPYDDPEYKPFVRGIYTTVDKVEDFRVTYNNIGLHKSTWTYNIQDPDNATLYGDFYMDFDSPNFEEVRQDVLKCIGLLKVIFGIKDEHIKLYFSGNKGIHLIIPASVFGIEPDLMLHDTFKFIVVELRAYLKERESFIHPFKPYKTPDIQPYHKKAFLRMENSIHEKTGLYKTRVTIEEVARETEVHIRNLAKNIRHMPEPKDTTVPQAKNAYLQFKQKAHDQLHKRDLSKFDSILEFDPPCIVYLLTTVTAQGTRNRNCAILCSHFKSRGYTFDNALILLDEWNQSYSSPRMTKLELKSILKSMYSSNKRYGCSSLKDTGGCIKDKCQLMEIKGKVKGVKP